MADMMTMASPAMPPAPKKAAKKKAKKKKSAPKKAAKKKAKKKAKKTTKKKSKKRRSRPSAQDGRPDQRRRPPRQATRERRLFCFGEIAAREPAAALKEPLGQGFALACWTGRVEDGVACLLFEPVFAVVAGRA